MISFSDAQMDGANDKKFQAQHNYLIELMSTYLTRGTLESLNKENFINLKNGTFKLGTSDSSEYIRQVGAGLEIKGKVTITGGNAILAEDLGSLAFKDEVKQAMEDELIIVGGYLDASFIKIRTSSTTSRLELTGNGLRGYLANDLRVEVKNDRLQFSKSGSVIGNVRTAPVTGYGECLFIEASGKYIAFNADSNETNPSMLVSPTWVDIPVLSTEEISIGEVSIPQWKIDTDSTDSILKIWHADGKEFIFSKNGSLSMGNSSKIKGTGTGNANTSYLQFMESNNTTRQGFIGYGTSNNSNMIISNEIGDIYLNPKSGGRVLLDNANIVGGTSNDGTWITCRRIGCGVAANSTYTVDAGANYIRAGKYYSGTDGGLSLNIDVTEHTHLGSEIITKLTFMGGILVGKS